MVPPAGQKPFVGVVGQNMANSVGLSLQFDARAKEIVRQVGRKFSAAQIAAAHAAASKFSSRKARDACRDVIVQAFAYDRARASRICVRKVFPVGWGLSISRKSVALGRGKSGAIRATKLGVAHKYMGRWTVIRSSFVVNKGHRFTGSLGSLVAKGRMGGVFVRDTRGASRRVRYLDKRGRKNTRELPIRQVFVYGPGEALKRNDKAGAIMAAAMAKHEAKFARALGLRVSGRGSKSRPRTYRAV